MNNQHLTNYYFQGVKGDIMPNIGASEGNNAISVRRIQDMKSKGLSNNQIIQTLQRDGYHTHEIFDALNQASVQKMPPGPTPLNTGPAQSNNMNPNMNPIEGPRPMPMNPPKIPHTSNDEEIIEAIIDEKWNDLMQDINKIISWKDKTEQKITVIDQEIKDLKDRFDKLHAAVVGKVGEYDQHILQVGAEIKAMEKVFSKVLPVFTENINELSRITGTMKRRR